MESFCEPPAVKSFCETHCNLRSQAVSGKKITDTVDDFVEGLRHFDKEGNGRWFGTLQHIKWYNTDFNKTLEHAEKKRDFQTKFQNLGDWAAPSVDRPRREDVRRGGRNICFYRNWRRRWKYFLSKSKLGHLKCWFIFFAPRQVCKNFWSVWLF